ncbi:MAG: BirA family biotin operon repressor/biotin-[acetyl-CoA-carboxylase] ligase [Gammaproteobacteria bacterium]|jgi:BirA family biotin operon repressor/biotin-[acetyl-CoA-carboxylase] ligase
MFDSSTDHSVTNMSMDKQQYLISRLADGCFHSGESLAEEMGISRAAVWKRIKSLADLELDIYSVNGKGHRLSQPIELLDANTIKANMTAIGLSRIEELKVIPVLNSTNQHLYDLLQEGSIHGLVVMAEYQKQGKGRRGNDWLSPYASGLCLSLGWHFHSTPASYTALSLATGVAVCRSLLRMGVSEAGLKWPNDIMSKGKKLGGILLESRSETAGCSDVVIGIGININLADKTLSTITQPVTDVNRIAGQSISRNVLSGILVDELLIMLEDYQNSGFSSCIEQWREFDTLSGQQADLILPNDIFSGEILGIDENGLLLMSVKGETKRFSSGELSLRVRS